MKIIFFLFLIALLVLIPISTAAAENQMSVSEIMLSGSKYFGTVTSDYEGLVTISSSDPNIAKVEASLYFEGIKKQKMFEVTPLNDGDVEISAKFGDDEKLSTNVRVNFPTTSQKTLELILPADYTSVSDIVGYVYMLDFGNTMIAQEDIDVLLTSKGDIQHPTQITILKGTTGASFDINIQGSSEISASSDYFESDTEAIQFLPRNINVAIDAPHIVAPNSLIYAVASFVENNMQYIPTQLRSATISSSNPEIISINPTNTSIDQDKTIYFDQDGLALIKLYAHNPGMVRISIHVSGFGSSTTEIFVGPTSVEAGTINSNGTSSTQIKIIEEDTTKDANTILGWIFPEINSGKGYIFAGTYFSKVVASLQIGADNIELSTFESTEYHPVVGQKSLYITSNGASHNDVLNVGSDEMPSNLGYVKLSTSVGELDVTISSPDILNPYTEQIIFGNPSYHAYQINIVPLPVVHGYFQDVALVGILDDEVLINPHRMGQSTQFTTTSKGVDVKQNVDFFDFGSSVSVISGNVKSGGKINVSVSDIGITSEQIYLSKPNTESHFVRIFTPSSTYIEEPFAAYAFIVDSQEVPIEQVTPSVSGMCESDSKNENVFMCNGAGTISYFSEFDSLQKNVDLIYQQFDNVKIDSISKLNVGQIKSININGMDSDIKVTVTSDIPNQVTGSGIILEPNTVGMFDVKVTLDKKGFETRVLDFSIDVSDDIMITVSANDGTNDIAVDVLVDGEFTKQTPFVLNHERKSVTLEFVESRISDVRNIIFNNLMVDDDLQISQNKITLDTADHFTYGAEIDVVAQYDPKLVVNTVGVPEIKTTTHNLGESVMVLPANDKPVFALLVYEKFDGWISDDVQIESTADGTAVFEIKQNTTLVPTYHTDYTNTGILVAVILVLGLISLQRRNNKFMLMMFVDIILRRSNKDDEYDDDEDDSQFDSDEIVEDADSNITDATESRTNIENESEYTNTNDDTEEEFQDDSSENTPNDKEFKESALSKIKRNFFKV